MARQKVESLIKSWQEADAALLEIGRLDREIEAYEADAQGYIEEIKERTISEVKPLQERKAALALQLQGFCEAHREEMHGKSRRLNFGTVSFRYSCKIAIRAVKTCVAKMMNLELYDYLIAKYSPNKERMRGLNDATLAEIGAKRVEGDVFGYEVDRERVREAA